MLPALSQNKSLRMTTLCGLYVAQGVPWGFVTIAFAAWLSTPEQGFTTKEIGPIMAVASLPWSFKFVWGPLMDRYSLPRFGRRRPWIIFAQSMAILVLGSMAFTDDLPSMIRAQPPAGGIQSWAFHLVPGPLAALILLANIFVSMQDVAVDALAVDLLKEDERGVANGLMYGSSYFGTFLGGAGLGYIVANFGIAAGIFGQAVILSLAMLLPIFFRERPEGNDPVDEDTPETLARLDVENTEESENTDVSTSVVRNLFRAFSLRATVLGILVALAVKIGIGVMTVVFLDYLLKEGGWKQDEYTNVIGGYAVFCGLAGSAIGGLLADRVGSKPVITTTSIMLSGLWCVYGFFPELIDSRNLVTVLLICQEFTLAVMSVALFSLFMTISWPRVAATQFTTYMAIMNLSTTIGSYVAGAVGEVWTISQILILAGLLQVAVIVPVLLIDPGQTRRILGSK